MESSKDKILTFESLLIGYKSGRYTNVLLPALDAFAFRGELIAVIGQNGIGKSTLLRTIAGLHPVIDGTIYLKHRNLNEYSRYSLAQNIGYISTEPVRVSNMKVRDLVSLGRFPHTNWTGKLGIHDWEAIEGAIEKVGMEDLQERFINELSDGERQRAMIARVLAQDTDLLILDEPTAFLDVRSKYEIVHLLHDLTMERGKTIVFSTHDLLTAVSESDKIWLTLKDAFIEGGPEDLILNGEFNLLFNSSSVSFNANDGSFTFRRKMRGTVFVDAQGSLKYWASKAVNRAGFEISNNRTECKINLSVSPDRSKWIITTDRASVEFTSLYELVDWLKKL
jgi:iron complex transport system ATP-binding protein